MEYHSDIPHRQYDPLHTRRPMAADSHHTDMPMGSMAAKQFTRHSPPIQPGEKLPSFSEFVEATRAANTPPRTPGRSGDNSPRDNPQFEEVPWQEGARQRNDTLGEIFASSHRRLSSAIDPALHSRGSPQPSSHNSMHHHHHHHHQQPQQHHRQSLSYPPPHMATLPERHYPPSSPPPQAKTVYPPSNTMAHYHPPPPPPPPSQHSPYEHRATYYGERQSAPQTYPYDRHHDSYYGQSSYSSGSGSVSGSSSGVVHPSYENGYNDIRFHQHVGIDHNAFNRKRRGNLPKEATNMLKEWFNANRASPYPTEDQKILLCTKTGLSLNQVSNWFINARRRAPQREARERESNGPDA